MSSGISDIFTTNNVAAATAAGTPIATLSHSTQVTQKGVYEVTAYATVGAAPGANDTDNIVVSVGATTLALPVQPVAGTTTGPISFNVSLDGATDVVAKVGANASVAPYSVTLVAQYKGASGGLRR